MVLLVLLALVSVINGQGWKNDAWGPPPPIPVIYNQRFHPEDVTPRDVIEETPNDGPTPRNEFTPRDEYAGETPRDWYAGETPRDGYAGETPRDWYAGETPRDGYAGETPRDAYAGATPRDAYAGETPRDAYAGETPRDAYAGETPRGGYAGETPRDAYAGATPRDAYAGETPRDAYAGETPRDAYAGETPRDGYAGETPRDGVTEETPRDFVTLNDHPIPIILNDGPTPRILNLDSPQSENPEALNRLTTENGEPLFEGDMILTKDQMDSLFDPLNTRKAIKDERYRWTNGVVPFAISASSQGDRQAILNGIKHWTDNSCLKFTEVSEGTQQPHLIFKQLKGCYSSVGMQFYRNGQDISIGNGCTTVGTVAHEIGHAIGFYHEQSRPDRDQYVKIFTQNMETDMEFNFQLQNDINSYGVPYDLGSLMHYGLDYFTKDGQNTMVPIDVMQTFKIGQRKGLSFYDLKLANIMYKCDAQCRSTKPTCRNGGFVDHNCRCRCPDGYQGTTCEKYVGVAGPTCGGTITSPTTISTPNYPNKYPKGSRCIWIVKAPGKKVNAAFETFDLIQKSNKGTCPWDFLEIRGTGYTGNKYCAQDLTNMVFENSDQLVFLFKADYDWNTGFRAKITFK